MVFLTGSLHWSPPLHAGLAGEHAPTQPFHHPLLSRGNLLRGPFPCTLWLFFSAIQKRTAFTYLISSPICSCTAFFLRKEIHPFHLANSCAEQHPTTQAWLSYFQYQPWLLSPWGMIPLPHKIKMTLTFSHSIREWISHIFPFVFLRTHRGRNKKLKILDIAFWLDC